MQSALFHSEMFHVKAACVKSLPHAWLFLRCFFSSQVLLHLFISFSPGERTKNKQSVIMDLESGVVMLCLFSFINTLSRLSTYLHKAANCILKVSYLSNNNLFRAYLFVDRFGPLFHLRSILWITNYIYTKLGKLVS